jgi:hypothetical protein
MRKMTEVAEIAAILRLPLIRFFKQVESDFFPDGDPAGKAS